MRIGEVARRAGLRSSAIRYYERFGLLPEPARVAGRREYDASVLDSLCFIAGAQKAGFTLAEIRSLRAAAVQGEPQARWREAGAAKLEAIERSIHELETARRTLEKALDCSCDGRAADCTLVAAG